VSLLGLSFAAHDLRPVFAVGSTWPTSAEHWAHWNVEQRADAAYTASLATYEVTAFVVGCASCAIAVLTYLGRRGKET
jgi:hypothetical protein